MILSEKLGTWSIKNGGGVFFPLTGEVIIVPKIKLVQFFKDDDGNEIVEITYQFCENSANNVVQFDRKEFPNLEEFVESLASKLLL